jgi:hypothetical protein
MDFTAPPADLTAIAAMTPVPAAAMMAHVVAPATVTPSAALAGNGLSEVQVKAEIATVPEPQRPLAAMLPLSDLPPGWILGKLGERHLETFNAENLFEKIDGRAESFIDYGVRGMAYADFHPTGDDSADVQVYIFEMGNTLKALGKYAAEKPEELKMLPIGSEGYASAGSTIFYSGPYYTQVVATSDAPKFADFALELARRIAAKQGPKPEVAVASSATPAATAASEDEPSEGTGTGGKEKAMEKPQTKAMSPEALFALLPAEPGKAAPKYVAQDAFGYSFLSDVFMADYQKDGTTWQGFLRPYRDAKEAEAVFNKYLEGAKMDGADIKTIEAEGADRMIKSANIGLIDVLFLKGNTIGGANGATAENPAEAFARAFVKSLPAEVTAIETGSRGN